MTTQDPAIRVVNLLPDPRVGGPQHRVAQVAERMRSFGIHTTVVIPPGPAVGFFQERQIPCIPFDFPRVRRVGLTATALRTALGLFVDARQLARTLRCNGTSILHCNGLLTVVGLVAGRHAGVKVLWHLNDTLLPSAAYSSALHLFKGRVDRIVFSSRAVGYHARYRGRIEVMYPPVNLERFSNIDRGDKSTITEHGLDPNIPTVVCVGNVNRSKGYEHLLGAIDALNQRQMFVQVLVVGLAADQELQEQLSQRVQDRGMQAQVKFVGNRSDVNRYYQAASVFVLPSVSEAMPMALLEAMACGLPCVATNVGGVEEVLHDGEDGLVVPPADPQALALAIEKLLSSPARARQMGQRAAREVAEKCSLDRIAEQQAGIYYDMMHAQPTYCGLSASS